MLLAGSPLAGETLTGLDDANPTPQPARRRTLDVFLVQVNTENSHYTYYFSEIGFCDTPLGAPFYYDGVWSPQLDQALNMTRQLPIGPEAGTQVSASWGNIVLLNGQNAAGTDTLGDLFTSLPVPGSSIFVRQGRKVFDDARGIWVDVVPLVGWGNFPIFTGVSNYWLSDGETLSISIRDRLAALELPVQQNLYGGAGGADGTATNAGKPIPKTRGKVLNISPVLIDPTNLIYQWTDYSGTVTAVYERGYAGFTFAGDFATYAALVSATVPAGQYGTCIAHGYLRMGTQPVGPLTIDATGEFSSPTGSIKPGSLALNVIGQEFPGFGGAVGGTIALDTACPYDTGVYTADQAFTGVALLDLILSGTGAALGTSANGGIAIYRIVPPSGSPALSLDTSQILETRAVALPDSVAVPNWRRTVGYGRNYTIETNNLSPSLTASQIQFLARDYASAVWSDSSVKSNYATARDAPLLHTQTVNQADAQTFANFLGSLWGVPRYLYDHDIPLSLALPFNAGTVFEIGNLVNVTYPSGVLESGKLGVIVGNVVDVKARKFTLRVLY